MSSVLACWMYSSHAQSKFIPLDSLISGSSGFCRQTILIVPRCQDFVHCCIYWWQVSLTLISLSQKFPFLHSQVPSGTQYLDSDQIVLSLVPKEFWERQQIQGHHSVECFLSVQVKMISLSPISGLCIQFRIPCLQLFVFNLARNIPRLRSFLCLPLMVGWLVICEHVSLTWKDSKCCFKYPTVPNLIQFL